MHIEIDQFLLNFDHSCYSFDQPAIALKIQNMGA